MAFISHISTLKVSVNFQLIFFNFDNFLYVLVLRLPNKDLSKTSIKHYR